MQLTEAVHHYEDTKMTFARLFNYAGYAIIRYAIKRVRLYCCFRTQLVGFRVTISSLSHFLLTCPFVANCLITTEGNTAANLRC